ncbi:hypothetical protein TVAG_499740 [Trichomonas vaginalis G3]|uniref:Uncharacterized protein n=1 Tax=Trichomonas vaginalis (strain ATCC PRA-98 / G3) TaxID=412133 RepID=A2EIQ9_TRIV3|nr:hypothetical protein TVAGG3_0959800 [Trichomonas vaginalis G3]EAY07486.1 hypothetical protein TVAG_499740 [Trichomonas vaginalis G3]KAI5487818.1 hypothetical protein TVAGG3_0959800 [Trichomonas vaginalis G3]|eukprot:XP_001319709.1 hypothetical protein [Trichomonas vaginalis G3]
MSADDVKQAEIDAKTTAIIAENGGINYLNANYIHNFAKSAIGANDAILARLQPDIDVDMNDPAWRRAMCVALAFIKRYHLDETRETMKLEFPEEKGLPSKTGFSKSKDIEAFFDKIAVAVADMKSRTFEKNVDLFAEEAGLEQNKRPTREGRRARDSVQESPSTGGSRGSHRHHRSSSRQ